MYIAIVGDLHGHLRLMFAIVGRWQRESGHRVSLILQVGDLGTFTSDAKLDQATRRHAERDPEELGFGEFAGEHPPVTLLDPRPPLVFIPGNHEDFDYLDLCARSAPAGESVYSVSADRRICALRSGRVWAFREDGQTISVGGVSGIATRPKRGRPAGMYLRDEDVLVLAARDRRSLDILISHDAPEGLWADVGRGQGSAALRLIVEEVAPRFAFFGHYNRNGEWGLGTTRVIGMSDCGYDHRRGRQVDRHGVGILAWPADGDPSFDWIAEPWLLTSTRDTWTHWGRIPARAHRTRKP